MWCSRDEAADALGIAPRSVNKRAERGQIRYEGDGRDRRFWIEQADAPTPKPASDADERFYSEIDMDRRVVLAYIPWLRKPLRVSFEDDATLHRAYSTDGQGMTQKEIAQHMGWDIKVLRGYLRARNLQHASEIWPEHEMAESTDESLLSSAEAIRAARLRRDLDKREVAALKREAAIGRNLESWLEDAAAAYCPDIHVLKPTRVQSQGESVHWFVPETDTHIDALDSDGSGWADQIERIRQTRFRMIDRCLRLGKPASWYWWCGSDWGNVDNKAGTTTRGTPQVQSLPPAHMVPVLTGAAYEACDTYLATGAPLAIIEVPGNHDWMFTSWLMECLRQRYADNDSVRFIRTLGGRSYVRAGDALVICAHGHIDRLNESTLREMAFTEAPDLVAGVRAIHVLRGDKHTRRQADSRGGSGQDVGIAAMSPQSPWSLEMGFGRRQRFHAFGITEDGAMPFDFTTEAV